MLSVNNFTSRVGCLCTQVLLIPKVLPYGKYAFKSVKYALISEKTSKLLTKFILNLSLKYNNPCQ